MAPRDVSQDRTITPETIERGIATISTLRYGMRKSMEICRICLDERMNRLLFCLGLVLKLLWRRWVCVLGDAFSGELSTNFLVIAIFYRFFSFLDFPS